MKRGGKTLTLYLSTWQKRMMRDLMGSSSLKRIPFRKITKMRIRNPIGICLASYKLPVDGIRRGDWIIYLTDEQINMVSEELRLRTPISSVNISPETIKSGAISFR